MDGLSDSPSMEERAVAAAAGLRQASHSSELETALEGSETSYSSSRTGSPGQGQGPGGGPKKKKSLFGKISKGFKNIADGFKRKSSVSGARRRLRLRLRLLVLAAPGGAACHAALQGVCRAELAKPMGRGWPCDLHGRPRRTLPAVMRCIALHAAR